MSPEETEALVRSFWDELTRGNLSVIEQFVAPEVIDHNPFPGQGPGAEGLKEVFQIFRSAFPDAQVTIEDFTAEGDRLAFRTVMRATHQGDFMGIAPTGKTVTMTGIELIRMADGKMAERWGLSDDLGLMQQLGVAPGSGKSGDQPTTNVEHTD